MLASISACDLWKDRMVTTSEDDRIPVARVGDHLLYENDLKGLVSEESSSEDSIIVTQNYIESWVKEKLMVDLAEEQLREESQDIEDRLVKYRESLYTYKYEQEYLNQNLDTTVQDTEIAAYFEAQKGSFILSDHIGKFISVTIEDDYPKQDSILFWLENIDNQFYFLQKYCVETSADCWLQENVWKSYNEIGQIIEGINLNQLVQGRVSVQTIGDKKSYILLLEFIPKNQFAPIEYKRDEIIKILINKKRIALIKKLNDEVYQDAVRNGKFEIY